MKLSLALLLLLSLLALTRASGGHGGNLNNGEDFELEEEDEHEDKPEDKRSRVRTLVEGKSGRIRFSGQGPNLNETVVVEFKKIIERTSTGGEVDPRGRDHKVDDFENVQFTFSNDANSTYQNLQVRNFSFSASNLIAANDGSKLLVEIYTFKEEGSIQVDGAPADVKVGTVKFNVAIINWPFCNSNDNSGGIRDCRQDHGAYVDFSMKIKSENKHEREDGVKESEFAKEVNDDNGKDGESRNRRYRLGASTSTSGEDPATSKVLGPELVLSSKVTVDGALVDQAVGFPKIEGEDDEQKFIFRFPRGNTIYYDPVLTLAGASSSAMTVVANAALVLFATLFATFALRS